VLAASTEDDIWGGADEQANSRDKKSSSKVTSGGKLSRPIIKMRMKCQAFIDDKNVLSIILLRVPMS
jgi:hypothetical protein